MGKASKKEELNLIPEEVAVSTEVTRARFLVILYERLKNLNFATLANQDLFHRLEVLAAYDESLKSDSGILVKYYFNPETHILRAKPVEKKIGFRDPSEPPRLPEEKDGFDEIDEADFCIKLTEFMTALSSNGSSLSGAMTELNGLLDEIKVAEENGLVVKYHFDPQTSALSIQVVKPRTMGFKTSD